MARCDLIARTAIARCRFQNALWVMHLLLSTAIFTVSAQEFVESKESKSLSENVLTNEISESTNSKARSGRYDILQRPPTSFGTGKKEKENCENSVECDGKQGRATQLKVTYHESYRIRAQQCKEFDKKTYNGKRINWKPYLRGYLDECKLFCLASGHRFYARLKKFVNNGTPCGKDYSKACINGKCRKRPRGCQSLDGPCVLEERKKILGVFNSTELKIGYNFVATIPAGATNITIEELTRSRSYLALKDHNSGKYYLNGHWMIVFSKTLRLAGTKVRYDRDGNTRHGGERITVDGPLEDSLDIMMIFQRDPSIILYSYFVTKQEYQKMREQSTSKGQYLFFTKHRQRTNLSVRTQHDSEIPRKADDKLTNPLQGESISFPPEQKQTLYLNPGRQGIAYTGRYADKHGQDRKQTASSYGSSWIQFGGNEENPKQPAEPSTQYATRPFLNQQLFKPNLFDKSRPFNSGVQLGDPGYQRAQWGNYRHSAGQEFARLRTTNYDQSWRSPANPNVKKEFYTSDQEGVAGAAWRILGFTSCSSSCAGGTQSYIVKCVESSTGENISNHKCDANTRPQETRRACNLQPCPASWEPQEWNKCSKSCGQGVQMRDLMCKQVIDRNGEKVTVMLPVVKCPEQLRPEVIRKCFVKACPQLAKPKWIMESWDKCSVECGHGVQKRNVVCKNYKNETVDDSECPFVRKPVALKACYLGLCKAGWYVRSHWSQCSRTCGTGIQSRSVVCARIEGSELDEKHCKGKEKPKHEQACNTQHCKGTWMTSEWSKCSTDCGDGLQERIVICMKSVNGNHEETSDSDCSLDAKPAVRKDCSGACKPSWFATTWAECSASCGLGVRTRHVSCLNGEGRRVGGCRAWERPQRRQACNVKPCPGAKRVERRQKTTCKDNPPNRSKSYCAVIERINYCRIPSYRKRCCQTCWRKRKRTPRHV